MLKQLSVNIPLVEALEQMQGYAKFMKDLVTKKKAVSIDLTNDVHHCSAIATISLVQKKEDPGAFTILCTIGLIIFAKSLHDLGASINLMPLAIYKQLGLGIPRPTSKKLMIADRLSDLDCEVDFEVPIILGRPFFATGRALPHDMNVVFVVEVVNKEEMRVPTEERMDVETVAAVLMNFKADFWSDYVETVNALQGIEQLPSHLRYVLLGANNTLPVILATDLNDEQVQAVIKVLIRYKRSIEWTIEDIIEIPPGICTHKIQLDEDCIPSINTSGG
ncbi:uncharacterized protein LOC125821699 [Solanum verrucosum]|uniref:uncharacterized protein LOC125821699 n=1 Tax=Solanum verrucosum TaxID=315347 RepID=UPI0020D065AA|nr:uncharacterized protein LOC125821699 [Solanum verrucosum]